MNPLQVARKYVQQAHDDAEARHDSDSDDYMSGALYDVMQETAALLVAIDAEDAPDVRNMLRRARNLLSHPFHWAKENSESRHKLAEEIDSYLTDHPASPAPIQENRP